MKMTKQYRLNGLSFKEELKGEYIPFNEKIVYLGLNGVLQPCNWECRYCLEGAKSKRIFNPKNQLSLDVQNNLIKQASEHGLKTLMITGGEPFHPQRIDATLNLIEAAEDYGLIPLIYTNGSFIDKKLGERLTASQVSLALKVESLNEETYDKITETKGSYRQTMELIDTLKKAGFNEPLFETDSKILTRLLFTTVGTRLNVDEYVGIARFSTNNGARWMMELLNFRGNAENDSELSLSKEEHSEAMDFALRLNPEQRHNIDQLGFCRLFSMITVNTSTGNFGICPQDYDYLGNIKDTTLKEAMETVLKKIQKDSFLTKAGFGCPIKKSQRRK